STTWKAPSSWSACWWAWPATSSPTRHAPSGPSAATTAAWNPSNGKRWNRPPSSPAPPRWSPARSCCRNAAGGSARRSTSSWTCGPRTCRGLTSRPGWGARPRGGASNWPGPWTASPASWAWRRAAMTDPRNLPSLSSLKAPGATDPAERLSDLWRQGQRPDVHEFLAGVGSPTPTQMLAALRLDQQERWRAGERIAAEAYLQPYPALQGDPELAVELICGEYLLREELGETPPLAEYQQRFPHHADRLRQQIEFHEALKPATFPGRPTTGPAGERSTQPAGAEPATGRERPATCPAVPGHAILGELGRGGMGVVYKARHLALNRLVALKMILAGPHAGPEELARFKSEAEAVARLQHPNIVQVYEVGEHDGLPFFSLEFVDGGTLEERLAEALLAPGEAARLGEVLARAVHYAHERGIIHRDLKPANILLQGEEWPAEQGYADFVARINADQDKANQGKDPEDRPEQANPQAAHPALAFAAPIRAR